MRKLKKLVVLLVFTVPFGALAQTSWKGTTSTSWSTAANWTAGIPTSALDAIIGANVMVYINHYLSPVMLVRVLNARTIACVKVSAKSLELGGDTNT